MSGAEKDKNTGPVMPERQAPRGSEGNWPVEQFLNADRSWQEDQLRAPADRFYPPGTYILGYRVPAWQRRMVWIREQQVSLIESGYLGYDIGRFMVTGISDDPEMSHLILDGQHRLEAIRAYLAGDFPVFGALWHELPKRERQKFFRLHMTVYTAETHGQTEAGLRDIYARLNFSGVPHASEQHLGQAPSGAVL